MKVVVTLVLLLVLASADAQYTRYVVQFTDKANNAFNLNAPSSFLSQRAIERHSRYSIPYDSLDLPVTRWYIDSVRAAGSVDILSTSKWLNQVLIRTTDAAALSKIASFAFVRFASPVAQRPGRSNRRERFKEETGPLPPLAHRPFGANVDAFDYGANFQQVHIHEGEYLHNKGLTGSGIHIAVLDAGFSQYKTITAFDTIRMKGQVLGERDFVDFDNSVNEDDSHGMFCLSTMAANWPTKMVGTAPKSSYWLLRTEDAGSEYPIEEHNWAAGAEFADSAGADMISSSLGYIDFDDPSFDHSYDEFYKNIAAVTRAASTAVRKGMIVMNSAGNSGASPWRYLGFPADADSVCAVGAIDVNGTRAGFSAVGYPGKVKPNVMSVGAGTVIAGFGNEPVTGNGTSFSNPNLAGLVACLWQAFPQFNNMKILDAVYKSSDRYNNPDSLYGFGIPNFRKAHDMLQKDAIGVSFTDDWLVPVPNPFRNNLSVFVQVPEAGKVSVRLVDAIGRTVDMIAFNASENEVRNITFSNASSLSPGVYFLQYISNNQKRTKKLLKL